MTTLRTVLCFLGLLFCGLTSASAAYDNHFLSTNTSNLNVTASVPPDQDVRSLLDNSRYTEHLISSGVDKVHMELGIKGAGVKIAISSTGVNVQHDALFKNYAGRLKDNSTDHNYNWFDAYQRRVPIDTRFVGTHITGVAISPFSNIGAAPRAKFIACRSIDELERDSPESQISCLQFFHQMHDLNRMNPRPELRPDVVFTQYSDTSAGKVLRPAIQDLLNAGVFVITNAAPREEFSSFCAKQSRAPSFYPEVLTVGALSRKYTSNEELLSTSSGGPIINPNGTINTVVIKPNVVVTGGDVVSSVFFEGQSVFFAASGTPISGGLAVGITALVISSNPKLKRRVRDLMEILHHAAKPIPSLECSSLTATPNNKFGYGKLDAYVAVKRAMEFPYGGCPVKPVDSAKCKSASFSQLDTSQTETIEGENLTTWNALNFVYRTKTPKDLAGLDILWNGKASDYLSLCIYDTPFPETVNTEPFFLKEGFKIGANYNKKVNCQGSANLTLNDGIFNVTFDAKIGMVVIAGSGENLTLSRAWATALQKYAVMPSVVVQLRASTGACWSSNFTASQIVTNTKETFRGVIQLTI